MVISVALPPDPQRALACDARWRERLGRSFEYLGEVTASRDEGSAARLASVRDRVAAGPVSPWVTCLYSRLVAELSRKEPGPIAPAIEALSAASLLAAPEREIVTMRDDSAPADWWDHFAVLIDTDGELPFHPQPASEDNAHACRAEIEEALSLLAEADPPSAEEFSALVRLLVLSQPESRDARNDFGACSTFFLRETVLVNAANRRTPVKAIDMLVHEASHILLFSLAMDQPLTTDTGQIRHQSAARRDLRPIDGIFHAGFVSTRVHLAMERMLASGRLSAAESAEAVLRRERNRAIAVNSIASVTEKAPLTENGERVLAALSDYWANQRAPERASA